jgi:hypothetical protein
MYPSFQPIFENSPQFGEGANAEFGRWATSCNASARAREMARRLVVGVVVLVAFASLLFNGVWMDDLCVRRA